MADEVGVTGKAAQMSGTAEIENREADLRQAMLRSDIEALDQLLADALVFTNQNGQRLTKADDLEAHRSGLLKIGAIDTSDMEVRVHGDAAIVAVSVALQGRYAGASFGGTFAYTRLWLRADGTWRAAAAHCSQIAVDS